MSIQAIQSPVARAVEEATETAAQSKMEAAQGDRQAALKMARLSQLAVQQATPAANPPGTGTIINVNA